eukprot:16278461-Heterocapsa_arctica.AAC.1
MWHPAVSAVVRDLEHIARCPPFLVVPVVSADQGVVALRLRLLFRLRVPHLWHLEDRIVLPPDRACRVVHIE